MRTAARAALLDRVVEEYGVERLPGAHCYEFYAGPRRVRRDRRRGPRHVLPDRLPGPQLRRARLPRPGPRPPPATAPTRTSATTGALVYLSQHDDPELPAMAAARRRAPRPRLRAPADGLRRARARSMARAARPTPRRRGLRAWRRRRVERRATRWQPAAEDATLTVISWRDIPCPGHGQGGPPSAQGVLPRCGSRPPIDKAADNAGKKDMDEYLAEWRRAARRAARTSTRRWPPRSPRLEADYPRARLTALTAGGVERAVSPPRHRPAAPRPRRQTPTEAP